ncbi:MAG: septum formation initiator family protein [Eubacteriales bacterium]
MNNVRPKKRRIHFTFFIFLAILVYAVVTILNQSQVIKDQEERQSELVRQQESLEAEINALKNELEYIGSDEYIEQEARERLGWVSKDEMVFTEAE